jgi:hypothetical protein
MKTTLGGPLREARLLHTGKKKEHSSKPTFGRPSSHLAASVNKELKVNQVSTNMERGMGLAGG